MNERNFDEELDALLEELISSELSASELRERSYGADPELRALLEMAAVLRAELRPQAPDPEYARNAEIRILNRMRAARKRTQVRSRPAPKVGWFPGLRLARVALAAALMMAVILTGTVGTAAAASEALPGDSLYSVKRGIEQARLALTFSNEGDLELLGRFSDERLEEISALLESGRYQDLTLALDEYSQSLARYEQLGVELEPQAVDSAVNEKLLYHVEVLRRVQDQVPAQAQLAIEKVIERQLEHAQEVEAREQERAEEQTQKEEERQAREQERIAEQNQRFAEQIARQYDVTPEQVMLVFEGQCEQDWICVRAYFRELISNGRGKRGP